MTGGLLIATGLAWSPAVNRQTWRKHGTNPTDEITVVLTLKRPRPAGASFLEYAFEDVKTGVLFTAHYSFTCAGIRLANGQIHAVMARTGQGNDNKVSAIIMSLLSTADGKSLISHRDEKLEFRLVLNQRVFETTFIVNSTDLLDGTETVINTAARVDEPTPATLP